MKARDYDAAIVDDEPPAIGADDLALFLHAWCPGTVRSFSATRARWHASDRVAHRLDKPFDVRRFGVITCPRATRPPHPVRCRRDRSPRLSEPTAARRTPSSLPTATPGDWPNTLKRCARAVPEGRKIVVTIARHARVVARTLDGRGQTCLLVQPRDRGSAIAALLTAHVVSERSSDATLAIVPGAPDGDRS